MTNPPLPYYIIPAPHTAGRDFFVSGGNASGNSTRRQPKHPEEGMLFAPGYQDSVLKGKNQLEHMIRYMEQNPMRLATKKEHPDLFRVVRGLSFSRSGLSIARQSLTTQD